MVSFSPVFWCYQKCYRTISVDFGLLPLQSKFFQVLAQVICVKPLHVLYTTWFLEWKRMGRSTVGPGLQEALGRVVENPEGYWREILFCARSRERCSTVWAWGTVVGPTARSLWGSGQPFFLGESGLMSHELMAALPGHTSWVLFFFMSLLFFDPHLNISNDWSVINIP